MMGNQAQRSVRTEELYQEILSMVCEDVLKEVGETGVRGKLDALLSMGKIEGRITALSDGPPRPVVGDVWRDSLNPDREVEVREVTRVTVTGTNLGCPCEQKYHAATGHASSWTLARFVQVFKPVVVWDRLIEDWQRIVDSV